MALLKNNMKNLCKCDKCGRIEQMDYFSYDEEFDIPNNWREKDGRQYCEFCKDK